MITSKVNKNGRFNWVKFSYWISRISQMSRIWIFPRIWLHKPDFWTYSILFLKLDSIFLFWDSEVDFFESREWMIQLLTLRNKSEILNHLLVSHLVQVWWPRPPSFSRSSWRPRDESRRPWPRDCLRPSEDSVRVTTWYTKNGFKEDDGGKQYWKYCWADNISVRSGSNMRLSISRDENRILVGWQPSPLFLLVDRKPLGSKKIEYCTITF